MGELSQAVGGLGGHCVLHHAVTVHLHELELLMTDVQDELAHNDDCSDCYGQAQTAAG